jgi:hypothetical protein
VCVFTAALITFTLEKNIFVRFRSFPGPLRSISLLIAIIVSESVYPETDKNIFFQCKSDQCGSKNTHAAVPEKLTINFVWP